VSTSTAARIAALAGRYGIDHAHLADHTLRCGQCGSRAIGAPGDGYAFVLHHRPTCTADRDMRGVRTERISADVWIRVEHRRPARYRPAPPGRTGGAK